MIMLCKKCKNEIMDDAKFCPNCGTKTKKKPFYKKWWAWAIAIVIIGAAMTTGINESNAPNDVATQMATTSDDTQTKEPETTETPKETAEKKESIPTEYKSALKKAKLYSDTMHMSKRGIYDQLTSEYGERFSKEAAQYAVDNVDADWNANALEKAKLYQDSMSMSPAAIRDQLTSEYGEQFTAEEAAYAVAHLE